MSQDPELGRRVREATDRAFNSHAQAEVRALHDQRVIDDFVVERIGTYFDADDARDAFGSERLYRLEREGRIVVCGDPGHDDCYTRATR